MTYFATAMCYYTDSTSVEVVDKKAVLSQGNRAMPRVSAYYTQ